MVSSKFTLSSPAFEDGTAMPTRYAHQGVTGGKNVSVPLQWENPPDETKSFALVCVDIHPIANNWVHWLVVNIPKESGKSSKARREPANCRKKVKSL